MPRLIDADALIDFLDVGHLRHPSELCFSEVDVANLLLHAPTISPDEVRGVGEWIMDEYEVGGINGERQTVTIPLCSVCETHNEWKAKFCPSCGARMKGAEVEDGTTDNS